MCSAMKDDCKMKDALENPSKAFEFPLRGNRRSL